MYLYQHAAAHKRGHVLLNQADTTVAANRGNSAFYLSVHKSDPSMIIRFNMCGSCPRFVLASQGKLAIPAHPCAVIAYRFESKLFDKLIA